MSSQVTLFGEVLFDRFPNGRSVLGGAPFNVAWHLQAFGLSPRFVSRVGVDESGRQVREAMRDWGMDTGDLQTDDELPTGRVEVSLHDGEPAYDIVHPVAWDAIVPTPPAAHGPEPRWLYHGSLALRDARSRSTLERLAGEQGAKVFMDVNLRPPWWQASDVRERVAAAQWVKVNEDELDRLAPKGRNAGDAGRRLLESAGLEGLIITRGADGASLLGQDGTAIHAPAPARKHVVDTVGAGDAFAAVTLLGLQSGWHPGLVLERAQAFAGAVCALRGATVADHSFYEPFLRAWGTSGRGSN